MQNAVRDYKFPAHVEASLPSTDSDSREPPDAVKGDVARPVFYMVVRSTGDHINEPALFPTDWTGQITSSTNLMGQLSTLVQWNRADPVDAASAPVFLPDFLRAVRAKRFTNFGQVIVSEV